MNEMAMHLGSMIAETAKHRAIENSHGPYSWQRIEPSTEKQGFHFRIADSNDDIVAFRLNQADTEEATHLLNSGTKVPYSPQ